MEKQKFSNIVTAPEIASQSSVLYQKWKEDHVGSQKDFYIFMTVPSVERDRFLARFERQRLVSGAVVSNIITATEV